MLKGLLRILGLGKKDNISGLGLEIRELLKGKEIDPQKLIELQGEINKIEEVATLAKKTSHNQQEYCFPNTRAVEDEVEQLKIEQREFQTELRFILNN